MGPAEQILLLELMVCRPVPLVGHGSFEKILCAAPHRQGNDDEILNGTTDGICRISKDGARTWLFTVHNVSQIEILVDANLCLCIADGALMNITRVSSHVGFFGLYRATVAGGSYRVCTIKSSLSSTIKAFDVVVNLQAATLVLSREFYIPREALSVRFLYPTKLAVALKDLGFEMLFDIMPKKCKPIAVFPLSDMFLLCFDKVGFYIDRRGHIIRNELLMRWDPVPVSFALHEPYILAFPTRELVSGTSKRARCTKYRVLIACSMPGAKILALSLTSGDVVEMNFHGH
ncbi:CNH domain-containing protein [Mycena maculata]|uniref:CNH domain-containing protein n=1 Tax=Mycena maculata TaxID=230809 RepID=A0AAD7JFW0_9AGAR|nr:CNH domain-containing protein [Mycena maculata]